MASGVEYPLELDLKSGVLTCSSYLESGVGVWSWSLELESGVGVWALNLELWTWSLLSLDLESRLKSPDLVFRLKVLTWNLQ